MYKERKVCQCVNSYISCCEYGTDEQICNENRLAVLFGEEGDSVGEGLLSFACVANDDLSLDTSKNIVDEKYMKRCHLVVLLILDKEMQST